LKLCGLTLQSRGRAPASRVTPLISNVRRQKMRSTQPPANVALKLKCLRALPAPKHLSGLNQKVGPSLALTGVLRRAREAFVAGAARVVFGASRTRPPLVASTFPRRPYFLVAPATVRGCSALGVVERRYFSVQFGVASKPRAGYSPSGYARGQASAALPPNPSIERTSPGKPGAASHLKR